MASWINPLSRKCTWKCREIRCACCLDSLFSRMLGFLWGSQPKMELYYYFAALILAVHFQLPSGVAELSWAWNISWGWPSLQDLLELLQLNAERVYRRRSILLYIFTHDKYILDLLAYVKSSCGFEGFLWLEERERATQGDLVQKCMCSLWAELHWLTS